MRPLVYIPQHFGALLFDRRSSRYYPFDRLAAAFLRDWVDQPYWRVASDHPGADGLLERLLPLDLFGWDDRLAATVLDADPPDTHLLGPLATHVEVIARCNLRCGHCFASPLPEGRAAPAPAGVRRSFRPARRRWRIPAGIDGRRAPHAPGYRRDSRRRDRRGPPSLHHDQRVFRHRGPRKGTRRTVARMAEREPRRRNGRDERRAEGAGSVRPGRRKTATPASTCALHPRVHDHPPQRGRSRSLRGLG